jgi:2-hydroxychromene-2-carboxylate isomerase
MNASPTSNPLLFYFDFLSPYAYLAWCEIHNLAARHQREVVPIPVLLAALLRAHGQRGPAEIAPKREYIFKHVFRLAQEMGRPFSYPAHHPFNPLLPLRLVSLDLPRAIQKYLIDRCFAALWAGPEGLASTDSLRLLLGTLPAMFPEVSGLAPEELIAAAESDTTKAKLRAQTEEAIAKGVFGVPTICVDGELFWGLDSLPHVDRFLSGRDPINSEVMAQLAAMQSLVPQRS